MSPDDQHVYSGYKYGSIQKWSFSTGQCVLKMNAEGHLSINTMVLSNDGTHLYSGLNDARSHHPCVWETETGKCIHQLTGHTDDVSSLALSPDGYHLYSGASGLFNKQDNTIRVWPTLQLTSDCDCEQVLTGHTHAVTSLVV